MTPHLLIITFRITTDKGLNLELKKKNLTFFAWSRNARRLHVDCIAYNLYENNFNTQHIFESRLDLDSSLSKIFFTILGVGRPCGEYGEKPASSYDTSLIEYHLQDHNR